LDREVLIHSLKNYRPDGEDEKSFIPKFLDLLHHPNAFQRHHLPGHVTGSAWIVDSSGDFVLLTHHAKLNKWLQPGGHADGEENVINVARREAVEETGLKDLHLVQKEIFDIDIHVIPARKDFPEHFHYDIRFLFRANKEEALILTDESHALDWVNVNQLSHFTSNNVSMLRMAAKARLLL
jgi:8-oxo-dGTP pyrophosphatase MutT (NUDIX family)